MRRALSILHRPCAAALFALGLGTSATGADLTVFAAASLKNAFDTIAQEWEAATSHTVRISYAGSSVLARQIEAGAPADVIVSANIDWMDRLEGAGLIAPETRSAPLSNRLVLIAPGPAQSAVALGPDLAARLGDGRLAMALVDAVPAGIYGKAALTSLGLWESVLPQVAQTDNARAALALVASGEAHMGIVYATDAGASDKVSLVAIFPPDSHPPIRYAMAAVADGDVDLAVDFLDFVQSPTGRNALTAEGFLWLDTDD